MPVIGGDVDIRKIIADLKAKKDPNTVFIVMKLVQAMLNEARDDNDIEENVNSIYRNQGRVQAFNYLLKYLKHCMG